MSIEDAIPPDVKSTEPRSEVAELKQKIAEFERLATYQQAMIDDLSNRLRGMDMISSGHLDAQPTRDEELNMFLREISFFVRNKDEAGLAGLVEGYIAQIRRRAEQEASIDELTQLPNRAVFDSVADAFLKLAKNYHAYTQRIQEHAESEHREQGPADPGEFSILMIDLDHFKAINDTYGHLAGDEVLRKVGALLRTESRKNDEVARYGGEEFVITYLNPDPNSRRLFAEKLRAEIENLVVEYDGVRIPLTASIGGAKWHPGEELLDVIAAADANLYRAKNNGRNRVVVDTTE